MRIFLEACEPVNLASRLPSSVVNGLIEKSTPTVPAPGDNLNCLNGSAPSLGLTGDGRWWNKQDASYLPAEQSCSALHFQIPTGC
jgi:hypothetical protein